MNSELLPNQDRPKIPLWIEIVGWYGAIAIVGAFMAVSFGWVEGKGWIFQLLNLTGALGLITISWAKRVYQNVALNLVWCAIGIVAIIGLVT
jgi:hypothetical protein